MTYTMLDGKVAVRVIDYAEGYYTIVVNSLLAGTLNLQHNATKEAGRYRVGENRIKLVAS